MISNYFWGVKILLGFLGVFGVQYGIKKILSWAGKKRGENWHLRFATILMPPLSMLIWVLFGIFLMKVLGKHFEITYGMEYLGALRKSAVVVCFAWILFRWKNEIEHRLIADPVKKVDATTVQMVGRLVTLALGLLTSLLILQTFGLNIAPLLAFGSIGAASIGFAGKDVMANFCSGIMLQISRPFVRGDQIYLPEKHIEGHIEEIGWFKTSIRDLEKRAVYLPNNYFSTMVVVNITRITHKRLKQTLKIPLTAIVNIPDVVAKIRETILRTETIDAQYPVHVFLKTFGDYACELEIDAYSTITDSEAFNRFQQEMLLKIQLVLAEKEIAFAIPTISLKQTF